MRFEHTLPISIMYIFTYDTGNKPKNWSVSKVEGAEEVEK